MVITHLVFDDSVPVRHALTLNPCSNMVDIGSDRKNMKRSSLTFVPTPQS
jgi:hypothetical protein